MRKDQNGSVVEREGKQRKDNRDDKKKSREILESISEAKEEEDTGRKRSKSEKRKRKSHRKYSSEDSSSASSESNSSSELGSESDSESESEEQRRRKRKERKRREREERERKRRRKEKEKRRKRREKEEETRRRKKKKGGKGSEKGKKSAVTDSWGKYGIIRESDMWNKRPEFTAWLAEVKQVNLECLSNWEEKQMFKEFMEDHNTATFPSKKYYNLDAYFKRKMEKERDKSYKKVVESERTVFNDEEQRRLELLQEREKKKEQEVEALKRSMQSGMAQAMKEQAQLREEMAYQYKLGNFEAAAAIQRRLDPDAAM